MFTLFALSVKGFEMALTVPELTVTSVDGRLRLRPKDVSERYGISLTPIYQAIYKGELKARRFQSKVWLIEPQDAEDWIERCSTPNFA